MPGFTGNGVMLYRWILCKGEILMELKGYPSRVLRANRKHLLAELGLPPRTRNALFLAAVEQRIDEIQGNLKPGEVTP